MTTQANWVPEAVSTEEIPLLHCGAGIANEVAEVVRPHPQDLEDVSAAYSQPGAQKAMDRLQ